ASLATTPCGFLSRNTTLASLGMAARGLSAAGRVDGAAINPAATTNAGSSRRNMVAFLCRFEGSGWGTLPPRRRRILGGSAIAAGAYWPAFLQKSARGDSVGDRAPEFGRQQV